jgi:ectoine hydroxylase-related dioxygenase (phytanoyl-CoA dioxygenase family)
VPSETVKATALAAKVRIPGISPESGAGPPELRQFVAWYAERMSLDVIAHAREIAERGYTILKGVIEPELVDALHEDLHQLEEKLGVVPADNLFEGQKTVRIYNLLVHGELYSRIPIHQHVLPLVERVLDSGCLVSSLSSIAICPDETPQPLHADDQLIPLARPHSPIVCNTMWAITDFTEANGATRVVPGSHKNAGTPQCCDTLDTIAAEMLRGSVLVYNGSLWHGGGQNHTEQRRIGIAMNYCAGFIRAQENQELGIPRELVRKFPKRLQELVGYGVYSGLIGHIDKRNPQYLLHDEDDGYRAFDWATAPTR